jgi:D-3-phosphoglycerate dehydrogenase
MGLVAVTDHVFDDLVIEQRLLDAAGHELRFDGNARTVAEVRARVAGADAVLNCYAEMPGEVFDALDGCRVIARYGIGVDTIDLDAATGKGILVTNVPDYCIDEVSDHALALLLSLARGTVRFARSTREGTWSVGAGPVLHRLRGRTLGLIGFGRIARALAVKAAAVGFRIVAFDPYVEAATMRGQGAEARTLEELLDEADAISIHAPLTPRTQHLLGAEQFARMRPEVIVVNTSRGGLIDTDALRAALDAGRLGGVALDVLETEPPDPGDPLLRHPDVILTPHAAFASRESVAELRRKAVEQVLAALDGRVPPYALNAAALGR